MLGLVRINDQFNCEQVGQKFTVMISSIDEKRRSLVISEKKAWVMCKAFFKSNFRLRWIECSQGPLSSFLLFKFIVVVESGLNLYEAMSQLTLELTRLRKFLNTSIKSWSVYSCIAFSNKSWSLLSSL